MGAHRSNHWRAATLLVRLAVVALILAAGIHTARAMPAPIAGADSTPVLAYYYIWYTPDSWSRAKADLPLLGPYSSDDPEVMRDHVRWAKAAGIDGFIVSWKDTESLTKRLQQLVTIAEEESFKLEINYESLDFSRNPLPVEKVTADLQLFAEMYAQNPVFDLFGKPVVIWSGTWKYDRSQIEQATQPVRDRLQVLGSQKKPETYEAIADLVDGNAYYWSSVNPDTYPNYAGKLQRMADLVHAYGGLWIAPAAPGFDARHLGGEQAVDRADGATLETQLATALASGPDAVGLISWNEFSENSHVEPSCLYGEQYLSVIAALIGGTAPAMSVECDQTALATAQAGTTAGIPETTSASAGENATTLRFDWDSSAPEGRGQIDTGVPGRILLAPFSALMLLSVFVVVRRSFQGTQSPGADSSSDSSPPPTTARTEEEREP